MTISRRSNNLSKLRIIRARHVLIAAALASLSLITLTLLHMRPVMESYRHFTSDMHRLQILDRHGVPLSVTYQNRWNLYDLQELHEIPEFLQNAFIVAEDRRFYEHTGIDWAARMAAVWANVSARANVRGASTLSEQVVRMLHPRPRTLWSRWLEGWEAERLEAQLTKPDILEFYLNQVPYARNWRGVTQAARGYFNRDLTTLSEKEMLALAVLVRAPSALDPWHDKGAARLQQGIERLADAMQERGLLNASSRARIADQSWTLEQPVHAVNASHFVQYLRHHAPESSRTSIQSTLDASLQTTAQRLLNERLKSLAEKQVHNAGLVIADHTTGEVLAWVVAGNDDTPGRELDAVSIARQPGSALKPFLYAAALEKGWTAATLIDDAPLQDTIGTGLHAFRNYSRHFYGPISLREALANSLNTPAVRTALFVGVEDYLKQLHQLGFASLGTDSRRYDVGLALGNGEVTLLELVQAYAALAHHGTFRPLRLTLEDHFNKTQKQIYSPPSASLIAHILSDPYARQLEFGASSVLNLPVQTAAKTGTSSDYRDAWAVGFNYRYVVGIWMGNLDQTPMDGVTGSTGPALTLRSVFAELNRSVQTRPLPLDRHLIAQEVCLPVAGQKNGACAKRKEYFLPGHLPPEDLKVAASASQPLAILRPSEGLQMAYDPRIPSSLQAFRFEIGGKPAESDVEWFIDGERLSRQNAASYLWPLARGKHEVMAMVWSPEGEVRKTAPVNFVVK